MTRAVCWWLVLMGLWLALSDNLHRDELVAGAFAATVGTALALVAFDRMSPGVRIQLGVLHALPRTAVRMTLDTGLLLRALWQTVVLRRPVRGRWIAEDIDVVDTPEGRGRRVFIALAGSAAPNRVVADTEGGRLVAHELVGSDAPLNPLAGR